MDNNQTKHSINTTKKLSFFSSILIVIGGSIGAGIFFKSKSVLENSQNSLVLAIFCWVIAAISIIAMALALLEVSTLKNDNLSLVSWTKIFNSRTTFSASKNYMFYIYLPLTFFYMPLYVIMSLQDGLGGLINSDGSAFTFGTNVDWLIWTIISLLISMYFIIASGLSSKIGNIQNIFITSIKFFPLLFVTIIGLVLIGINAGNLDISIGVQKPESTIGLGEGKSIASFAPGLGMFLAISAIFFAYDGFYVVAGIQSEMKEPKKTPLAIVLGLLVTTIIYLVIAIITSINGGSFSDMSNVMNEKWKTTGRVLSGVINLMIGIGILGIINGFSMWSPRFIEELIKMGELPFSKKYKDKVNSDKPKVGIKYLLIISIPIILLFTIIGVFGYIDNPDYSNYGSNMASLYNFADLMANWTALFIFAFIVASIYGCLRNRKAKTIETKRFKYFVPAAIISIIIISFSLVFTILIPIIDLLLIGQLKPNSNYDINLVIISRVMTMVTFLIFVVFTYCPIVIENYLNIKKFGSLEEYDNWKNKTFIIEK